MADRRVVSGFALLSFVSFFSSSLCGWFIALNAMQYNSNLVAVFLRFEAHEVVSRHFEAEP
jgi:hypothetical protein